MARNAARNSPTFTALIKQIDNNVVSTQGGKLVANLDDDEKSKKLTRAFAKWTRTCDFYDSLNLNCLIKLCLKTQILGGDYVIVFDDGLVSDSGKILVFEPDEIGSVKPEIVEKKYGKGKKCSLGRVYDENSRFIGAIVSKSQRGKEVFDEKSCYYLRLDPDASYFDSLWHMPRNIYRVAQGRGISPATATLANTVDLDSLIEYELASAKKNSMTLATIEHDEQPEPEQLPSAFDENVDFASMTDEQIEEAVRLEKAQDDVQTVSLNKLRSAECIYECLPANYRLNLLSTTHPNPNMPDFVRFLASRSSASFGLAECFATLQVEGSNYKAQQLISKPTFAEMQKQLEQVLDWIVYRWYKWARRKGIVDFDLDDDFVYDCDWDWPQIEQLDDYQYQQAISLKIKNCTASFREILGVNWKETLQQINEESKWFKSQGMVHPMYTLISGGESKMIDVETTEKEQEQ